MKKLTINNDIALDDLTGIARLCPFSAIDTSDGKIVVNQACRMCGLCVKNGPAGLFRLEETASQVDKSAWNGIAVYIEHTEGNIHPVSLELIGKARELAEKVDFPVYALYIGHSIGESARELLRFGVEKVFIYDHELLNDFLIEPYTNVFEDFVIKNRPSSILVGATPTGRSLAPRVAARLKTGLTADCTKLDIKENTDLVQIRPAFGGNIMAQIITPYRPQIATVRYKIFDAPSKFPTLRGELEFCKVDDSNLKSSTKIVSINDKEKKKPISEADVIVAVGRGIKSEGGLDMITELAKLLGGEVAATRPLIEKGWVPPERQIGLSGRTVKPKLIITAGISGAIQFRAGMENADTIVAINTDKNAGIFDICHYAIVGDLYDIIPRLIQKIREGAYDV